MTVRRRVLAILGAAALGVVWAGPAAAARTWRVGILDTHRRGSKDGTAERLIKAMRELGYVEGRDIEYVHRHPEGDWETFGAQLAAIAHELVRSRLDAIVASSTVSTKALQRATTTIPIVTNVGDPVGAGFAKSLVRPGGNITGVALASPELARKGFEYLKAIIPGDWTFAIAHGDEASDLRSLTSALEEGARSSAIRMRALSFKGMDAAQADRTLAAMRGQGIRVLSAMVAIPGIPDEGYDLLMARKYGLATGHNVGEDEVAKGALMSYAPDSEGADARKAFQLARILRGTPPGEIPFETPTTFRFTINRTTAKILGLTIPPGILLIADKVYE
jgi:putative ABC transport system substrate-binding protein